MAKKARPSVGTVRKEMTKLRNDLTAIIAAGEDKKGTLTTRQLDKAKKTKDALNDALTSIKPCIQLHSPY
jgi:hypothetical protein